MVDLTPLFYFRYRHLRTSRPLRDNDGTLSTGIAMPLVMSSCIAAAPDQRHAQQK